MKKITLFILVFSFFISRLCSQTIVSGNITGIWNFSGSPYIITGDVVIIDSLYIEPGVVIQFQIGGWVIEAGLEAKLIAIGTAEAPIIFEPYSGNNPGQFRGIHLKNSENDDVLKHCIVRYGTIGIEVQDSSPILQHCTTHGNQNYGISCHYFNESQDPIVQYCTSYDNGLAGIKFGCYDQYGPVEANIWIDRCLVYNNGIDGIHVWSGTNWVWGSSYAQATISNSTIINNTTGIRAYAYRGYATAKIVNCIISQNSDYAILNQDVAAHIEASDITYNTFWNNSPTNFASIAETGFGSPGENVNINDDPRDDNYNIYMDPLLLDPLQNDYRLKICSPAINAGTDIVNGQFVLDPDGSVPDMGVHFVANKFHQAPSVIQNSPTSGGNIGNINLSVFGTGFENGANIFLENNGDTIRPLDSLTHFINCGHLLTTLNLNNQATGFWDVIVELPGGTILVIPNGFEIIEGIPADPYVSLIGFNSIRANTWQTYTLVYGNRGNVNAKMVPLYIAVPQNAEVELLFDTYEPETPFVDFDTIDLFVPVDSILGEPFEANVYPILIPNITPNQNGEISFKLKVPPGTDVRLAALIGKPLHQDHLFENVADCISELMFTLIGPGFLTEQCIYETLNLINNRSHDIILGTGTYHFFANLIVNTGTTFLTCAGAIYGDYANPWIGRIVSGVSLGLSCSDLLINVSDFMNVVLVAAVDPNDKIGSTGIGHNQYLNGKGPYIYQINFENLETADVPAQTVIIVDTLNAQVFDLESLQLISIKFGDHTIPIPSARQSFETYIDLRPEENILLKINANLDDQTGVLIFEFNSLDPLTLLPIANPLAGFLPPNQSPPEGHGTILYSVKLIDSIVSGTLVQNRAYIYFDNNPVIKTNSWMNRVDNDLPSSEVVSLSPVQNDSTFMVSWIGEDNDSGLLDYTIFVSTNAGPYHEWRININETAALFTGKPDSVYSFYSIARDSTYNKEVAPQVYDATTQIVIVGTEQVEKDLTKVRVYPNPTGDVLILDVNNSEQEKVTVGVFDALGIKLSNSKHELFEGDNQFPLKVAHLSPGIYILKVAFADKNKTIKFIKN